MDLGHFPLHLKQPELLTLKSLFFTSVFLIITLALISRRVWSARLPENFHISSDSRLTGLSLITPRGHVEE